MFYLPIELINREFPQVEKALVPVHYEAFLSFAASKKEAQVRDFGNTKTLFGGPAEIDIEK